MDTIREITVSNKKGLHARAAAKFVRTAETFDAHILIAKISGAGVNVHSEVQEVTGSSILGIMMLGCECGSVIRLRANGMQAEAAVEALAKLLADKFGEE